MRRSLGVVFSISGLRWLAVTILLLAYILVSQGIIDGQGIMFNSLNCVGSVLMIASSLAMKPKDWAVVVFNVVWVAIGLATIAVIIF